MEAGKSGTALMEQLDGWVTKKELVTLTGVTLSQLQRWESEVFAWSNEQLVRRYGKGPATITLYHPLCIPMIQRLLEIKKTEPRAFEEWRWQLWLDGYPISVRDYCINAVEEAQTELFSQKGEDTGEDTLEAVEALIDQTDRSKLGPLTKRIYGRTPNPRDQHSLEVWVLHIAQGQKPLADWYSLLDSREPLDTRNEQAGLEIRPEDRQDLTIGEQIAYGLGVPLELAQIAPPREFMAAETLLQSLREATEEEWQQVREDYRSITGGTPILLYREPFMRAVTISFLMQMRRSEIQDNLNMSWPSLQL